MDDKIQSYLDWIEARGHRESRCELTQSEWDRVCKEIRDPSKSIIERVTRRLELFLDMELSLIHI